MTDIQARPSVTRTPADEAAPSRREPHWAPFTVEVDGPAPAHEDAPLVFRPDSDVALTLAAARADVIRLDFAADRPHPSSIRRVIAQLNEELAALGRSRSAVRILLDVHVILAPDETAARSIRSQMEQLDAMVGLNWPASATCVIAPATHAIAEARRLGHRAGADGVVLIVAGGDEARREVRRLLRASYRG